MPNIVPVKQHVTHPKIRDLLALVQRGSERRNVWRFVREVLFCRRAII